MAQSGRPLPPALNRTTDPQCIISYSRLIAAEAIQQTALSESVEKAKSLGKKKDGKATQSLAQGLIAIRVLGYLFQHVPLIAGIQHLARSIESIALASKSHNSIQLSLIELGEFYMSYFIRIFRRSGGPTRPPTDHPSRGLFEEDCMTPYMNLQRKPKNHAEAKSAALIRDGYRCTVTQAYDQTSVLNVPAVQQLIQSDPNAQGVRTNACHIIPEGLVNLQHVQPTNIGQMALENRFAQQEKTHESSTISAILRLFGNPDILALVTGEEIHDLPNIITMNNNLHEAFNYLDIWFEPTGNLNEYHLRVYHPITRPFDSFHKRVEIVTFSSQPGLPPPSPEYLALHAACCKVAHMSGAAEFLEDIDHNYEQVRSLQTLNPEAFDQLSSALKLGVIPRARTFEYGEESIGSVYY